MYSKVISSAVLGVDGIIISVEADVSDGLPMFSMVGYLSSSVKEAGERVRTALKNSGFLLPPKRITINLSPADLRKDGSGFDLPIAIGILLSMGLIPCIDMSKTVIIGELGLNGKVNHVPGILSMISFCQTKGINRCIVPKENADEAALIKGVDVIGVENLLEVVKYLRGEVNIVHENKKRATPKEEDAFDLSDIKGQEVLKRGIEIAVAGFHNILMTGAAGAGKSMIAKRIPTIMPPLNYEECIDVTKIYSVSGKIDNNNYIIEKRPFRSPHHTISQKALIGGGIIPKPGEVSLAHKGVLFLDEFPEFDRKVLEVMRQPLEDGAVTISRINSSYLFPADFMLVAAMNPCPCGNYPNMQKCICTPKQINRYQNKISGPLLDRIDINIEVLPVKYDELFTANVSETSKVVKKRIESARNIQAKRYKDESIKFNSELEGDLLKKYIVLAKEDEELLEDTFNANGLSARGVYRILKLSRTIADLEMSENITSLHLREAIYYRNNKKNDNQKWGGEFDVQ